MSIASNHITKGIAKLVSRSHSPLNKALFGRLSEAEFWDEAVSAK